MKKLLLIGIGFVLAVAVFGVAGFAYAQTEQPPEPQTAGEAKFPYDRAGWSRASRGARMGGPMGFAPGGMMGFGLDEGQAGPLHDYLWPALAEAFDLTDEQIEAFDIARQTIQGIREDLTAEEIQTTMQAAMTAAIENALADGRITQEQADAWLEHMEQMEGLAPRMPFGGRGKAGSSMRGFSKGVQFGRQMMLDHEYLDAAIADALDISVEELADMKAGQGFNLKAYADQQGLSQEELYALHSEIFSNAVNMALEDGAITQEQAELILERLENLEARGGRFDQP